MDGSQFACSDDIVSIANSLLGDLKNSYQIWEDLISKSGKFHSALKVALQASSAFLDAFQKVADLATKTLGGSKEIGACLTRFCMRQRSLESKAKIMSNHLVTSLANPLNLKVEEWRRALCQLEKDRNRQTKRARAELKRALTEAQRWEKKANKCGINPNNVASGILSSGVGPGVGHGIPPTANSSSNNSEFQAILVQIAKANREVGLKKELVENTEKAGVRILLLEERSRFCFLVSCLLPILECQSSMLSEIATLEELVQTFTKETEKPNQLIEDTESILLRIGRRDVSVSSRGSGKIVSVFVPDNSDTVSTKDSDSGSNLFLLNGSRNRVNSSDTDSDRPPIELMYPLQLLLESGNNGRTGGVRCSSVCDSTNLSIGETSSHSGGSVESNYAPGLLSSTRSITAVTTTNNCVLPNTVTNIKMLGSHESSLTSMNSVTSVGPNAHFQFSSNQILSHSDYPTENDNNINNDGSNFPHSDNEDVQFKTLCRPTHCRTVSTGGSDFPNYFRNSSVDAHFGSRITNSISVFHSPVEKLDKTKILLAGDSKLQKPDREQKGDGTDHINVDGDEINDNNEDDDEEDDGDVDKEEKYERKTDNNISGDEDGGEYVEVNTNAENSDARKVLSTSTCVHNSYDQQLLSNNDSKNVGDISLSNNGRHTISSAYERGAHSSSRISVTSLSFNPSVGKASSKDSGVDSSAILYPKQSMPPPVYTNLSQLTHAAQRKFSMSQLPSTILYDEIITDHNDDKTITTTATTNSNQVFDNNSNNVGAYRKLSDYTYMKSLLSVNSNLNTTNMFAVNHNWSVAGSLNKLHLTNSNLEEKESNLIPELTSSQKTTTLANTQISVSTSLSSSLPQTAITTVTQSHTKTIAINNGNNYNKTANMMRSSIQMTGSTPHIPNGTDPYSMELEELDHVFAAVHKNSPSITYRSNLNLTNSYYSNYNNSTNGINASDFKYIHNHNKNNATTIIRSTGYFKRFLLPDQIPDFCIPLLNSKSRSDYSEQSKEQENLFNATIVTTNNGMNISTTLGTTTVSTNLVNTHMKSSYLLTNQTVNSDMKIINESDVVNNDIFNSISTNHINPFIDSNISSCSLPVQPLCMLSKPMNSTISSSDIQNKYYCKGKSSTLRPHPPIRRSSVLSSSSTHLSSSGISVPCNLDNPNLTISNRHNHYIHEGSSRASSVTMASSATNESLQSSTGSPSLIHLSSNVRVPVSLNDKKPELECKLTEHYASSSVKASQPCFQHDVERLSLRNDAYNHTYQNIGCLIKHDNENNVSISPHGVNNFNFVKEKRISRVNLPTPPVILPATTVTVSSIVFNNSPNSVGQNYALNISSNSSPPPPPTSVLTANLMSELSSQLQMMTARTSEINFSDIQTNNCSKDKVSSMDDFELPPPPPPSMFERSSDYVETTDPVHDENMNSSTQNQSPLLIALKQSVQRRMDRLNVLNTDSDSNFK